MKNTEFSEHVKTIKEGIYNVESDDLEINGLLWTFLVVSSNLSLFLPKLKVSDHYRMVQNMQYHRSVSGIDLYYPTLLQNTKFYDEDNVFEQSSKKGHIFVGYHAGSYYMMLLQLSKKNVPFCVVAGNNYIDEYGELVLKVHNDLTKEGTPPLELYSAEDPKLLLKLTKVLRDGISVFFFIDGNLGSKGNDFSNDKNMLKINFLEHHIYARQGVSYLAYLSKAPIATIVAKRDENLNNTVKINLLNTDKFIAENNRNEFVNLITHKLYGELENFLVKNFEQWSGWFYIHELFDTETLKSEVPTGIDTMKSKTNEYVLNEFIHLIDHDENNLFLVMKKKYEVLKIEKLLFEVLTFFKTPRKISSVKAVNFDNRTIGTSFIEELIEVNYLKLI